jgi:spermidine synthase
MIPWETLERVSLSTGAAMSLHRRGDEYVIRVDGQDLMGSRQYGSELSLAERGCAALAQERRARVLIGGLGMGFTLRAALDVLPLDAEVEVVELVPQVVVWNRGVLAPLAQAPLADPRVRVIEADVRHVIAKPERPYHAILLDVDNGPEGFTAESNDQLYGLRGIRQAFGALRPGGVLAVWSAADDAQFTKRLRQIGFDVAVERPLARHNGPKRSGKRHVLWLASRPLR